MITTDYFDLCESSVITLLQDTAQFNWVNKEKQVAKSNDVFLDQGFDSFALTYPGAFPSGFAGTDVLSVQWEVLIDLLVRWKNTEDQAWRDFKAFRSLVFNLFNLSYEGRKLNRLAGVTDAVLTAPDRPRYIPLNRDPASDIVSHIAQVTILTVTMTINKEE